MNRELKILTLNCNGIADKLKKRDIFDRIRNTNCNIYFLQETHLKEDDEDLIRASWGYDVVVAGNSSNSGGTAVLFKNNFEFQITRTLKDPHGQFILISIQCMNKKFLLINIYGPSAGDNDIFFQNISDLLDDVDDENIIIGGDFNCVLNLILDRKNCTSVNNRPKTREKIFDLMTKYSLSDVFREIYPDKLAFSWKRFNTNKQARLDYFLISDTLVSEVKDVKIDSKYKSDHAPVILSINVDTFKRDKSFWKFNNSLLHDKEYLELVKKTIKKTKKEYCSLVYNLQELDKIRNDEIVLRINDDLFLEVLLLNIRGETISFATHKKRQTNLREKELEKTIFDIENDPDNSNYQNILES